MPLGQAVLWLASLLVLNSACRILGRPEFLPPISKSWFRRAQVNATTCDATGYCQDVEQDCRDVCLGYLQSCLSNCDEIFEECLEDIGCGSGNTSRVSAVPFTVSDYAMHGIGPEIGELCWRRDDVDFVFCKGAFDNSSASGVSIEEFAGVLSNFSSGRCQMNVTIHFVEDIFPTLVCASCATELWQPNTSFAPADFADRCCGTGVNVLSQNISGDALCYLCSYMEDLVLMECDVRMDCLWRNSSCANSFQNCTKQCHNETNLLCLYRCYNDLGLCTPDCQGADPLNGATTVFSTAVPSAMPSSAPVMESTGHAANVVLTISPTASQTNSPADNASNVFNPTGGLLPLITIILACWALLS
jgi:hypothetical protein